MAKVRRYEAKTILAETWSVSSKKLALEYADYLSNLPWDYYSTVTFRERRSNALYWADRVWQVFERFEAYRVFLAVEKNRLNGIHCHLLSAHVPSGWHESSLWKYCFKAFGRTQIESITSPLAVSRYCAKYVVKGDPDNFFFKGDPYYWNIDRIPS